jgi:hypothetical protein
MGGSRVNIEHNRNMSRIIMLERKIVWVRDSLTDPTPGPPAARVTSPRSPPQSGQGGREGRVGG